MRRLGALDAAFLPLETDTQPLHVGALLLLAGPPPSTAELVAHVARCVDLVPLYRRTVHRIPLDLGRPAWVDAPGADAADLVTRERLAAPGDAEALSAVVARRLERRLDVSRPLWAMHVVDGLPDDGWALVVVAHHALVDGFVGSALLAALLGTEAGASAARRPPPLAPPTGTELLGAGSAWAALLPYRAGRALADAVRDPARVRGRLARVRAGLEVVVRPDLPPSPVAGPLGRRRDWVWSEHDLAPLQESARRHGCTLTDLYLAALAAAYRGQLAEHQVPLGPPCVRAIVPVSRRTPGRPRSGNVDAAYFVDLPVHLASTGERLAAVTGQTTRAKDDDVAGSTEAVLQLADHVVTPVLFAAARRYARARQRRVNAVATSVRGPGSPQRLLGREVRSIVPMIPLGEEIRVSSALMSYAGHVAVSFTADAEHVGDVDLLRAGLDEELAALAG